MQQVGSFSGYIYPVSSTNKTGRHGITEVLFNVTLNTIVKKKTSFIYSIRMKSMSIHILFSYWWSILKLD